MGVKQQVIHIMKYVVSCACVGSDHMHTINFMSIIQVTISTYNKYDDHTQMMSNVHEKMW